MALPFWEKVGWAIGPVGLVVGLKTRVMATGVFLGTKMSKGSARVAFMLVFVSLTQLGVCFRVMALC